jgi:hypothetical protein
MKFKQWQKIVLIILVVFVLDGIKAYFVARSNVREKPQVEFKSMMFLGVWGVSFRYRGGDIEPTETIYVAPLLPIVTGRSMTK